MGSGLNRHGYGRPRAFEQIVLLVFAAAALIMAGCGDNRPLIERCGTCHEIPGVAGADGTSGPSLAGFGNREQIAGAVPNTPENLERWIRTPQAIKPGVAHPTYGATDAQVREVVQYLSSLK